MNFGPRQLFMLGGYLTWMLTYQLHLPVWGVAICGLVCFAICGAAYMFTVYWPLRSSPWKVTVTISTLGASIALKEIVRLIWGSVPLTMDPIVDGVTHIGSAYFNNQYILILVIGGGLMLGVYVLFEKTFIGKIMQATAQDRYASNLIGIPTIVAISGTYMVSMCLSGVRRLAGLSSVPGFPVPRLHGAEGIRRYRPRRFRQRQRRYCRLHPDWTDRIVQHFDYGQLS